MLNSVTRFCEFRHVRRRWRRKLIARRRCRRTPASSIGNYPQATLVRAGEIPETGSAAVSVRENRVRDRPVDSDLRVVPGDTALQIRVVVAGDAIDDVRPVREDAEAVPEAVGDEELAVLDVVELVALPPSVGGGVRT